MSECWRLAWQVGSEPHTEDHANENAALVRADELAREGRMAFVYPINEELG